MSLTTQRARKWRMKLNSQGRRIAGVGLGNADEEDLTEEYVEEEIWDGDDLEALRKRNLILMNRQRSEGKWESSLSDKESYGGIENMDEEINLQTLPRAKGYLTGGEESELEKAILNIRRPGQGIHERKTGLDILSAKK